MTHPTVDRRQILRMMCALGIAAPWATAQAQGAAGAASGRLLLGIAPGGSGTRLAEEFLNLLRTQHGRVYQLEHILGREGRRSIQAIKQAQSDGNTLLLAPSTMMTIFPAVYRELGYSPQRDLTPIAAVAEYATMFLVGPRVPTSVNTLDDYLGWVSENPESRHVGVTLRGSQGWLIGQQLTREKSVSLQVVSYAGMTSIISDLLGGNLAAGFVVTGNATNSRASGRLRALAVSSGQRWFDMPETPTFSELGLKSMEMTAWFGLFGPAGISAEVLHPLHKAVDSVLGSAAMNDIFKKMSLLPAQCSPQEVAERIERETITYAKAALHARLERI